jgi:dUTP pyrophosphatase
MRFEKVSYEQYASTSNKPKDDILLDEYVSIPLPRRATKASAGHDFFAPWDFTLKPGESIKIPSGIRVLLDEDKVLMCYPRSGLGFKYRLQLDNGTGIIDADYSLSDNEGHIFFKLTNDSRDGKTVTVKRGEAFAQGVILQYFVTEDDNVTTKRNGGFGSTTNK